MLNWSINQATEQLFLQVCSCLVFYLSLSLSIYIFCSGTQEGDNIKLGNSNIYGILNFGYPNLILSCSSILRGSRSVSKLVMCKNCF